MLGRLDPRDYQIATLASLLIYGLTALDFEVAPAQVAVTIAAALGAQGAATRLFRLPRFDPRSALISSLSLCLLLRTNDLVFAAAAAVIAIASKFVLRVRGKHLFNPTNLALASLLLVTGDVWVSPGQWGSAAFFAALMAGAGSLVVFRAARTDVAVTFAVCYLGLVFGRSWWLAEPLAIPMHRLQSGALLLFTFFMITDPRTTPDTRTGRMVFAALVAFGAWYIQFRLFRTNGLLWSLALCSLLTPVIDWCWRGVRYDWSSPSAGAPPESVPSHAHTYAHTGVSSHVTTHRRIARRGRSGRLDSLAPRVLRLLRREG